MSRRDIPPKIHVESIPAAPRRHAVRGFVITTALVMLVLYVAVYFAARTEGFRSYAQEYLEKRLGEPVRIGRSHATPGLVFVLGDLTTEGEEGGSLRVRELAATWSLAGLVRWDRPAWTGIRLRDADLVLGPGPEGTWEPALVARLAEWLGRQLGIDIPAPPPRAAEEPDAAPAPRRKGDASDFWERTALVVNNGNVSWFDGDGVEVMAAVGVDLFVTPVSLPHRNMTHFHLTAGQVRLPTGPVRRDMVFEALKTSSQTIVLTLSQASAP